ncbi:diguanylate cyclase domain-containing protein [Exiguobacterium qingdaonense]|uniref:diguanylate cyclase domain-containing protein n=1 Tax=Exiguobacterium qingdaonense TaxID=2751251 RepID=UPI001BEA5A10|nr:GGDEF domain-containing protein [Exiguobacterium qingdaonense]
MRYWSTLSLRLIALIVGFVTMSSLFSMFLILNQLPLWWTAFIPILLLSTLIVHRGSGSLILLAFSSYFLLSMPDSLDTIDQLFVILQCVVLTGLAYLLQVMLFQSQFVLRVAEARVNQLIAVDPETGFDNRDRFLMDVEAERNRLIRHGETFVVTFITLPILNDFKKRYGPSEYEWFLDYFSDELHEATRRTDKKYRVARDTFAVIFPQTSDVNAQVVRERVQSMLLEYSRQDGESLTINCSDKSFEVDLEHANTRLEEIRSFLSSEE